MAKPATAPLSPTVTAAFAAFFKKLEEEKIADKAAVERLAKAVQDQKFDHESLRAALFGPPPEDQ